MGVRSLWGVLTVGALATACSTQVIQGSSGATSVSGSSTSTSTSTSSSSGTGGTGACVAGSACNQSGATCEVLDADGCPEKLICSTYCGDDCTGGPQIWQPSGGAVAGAACATEGKVCTYATREQMQGTEVDYTTELACTNGAWAIDWQTTCQNGFQGCVGPANSGDACTMLCAGCSYQGKDPCAPLYCAPETGHWQLNGGCD